MTLRAALYSRVSTEMQRDGYSLDAQHHALRDACAARGYEIAIDVTDEGISARSERIEARPGLVRILEAVDAGQVDVLLVHSLDRLSRNVMVTLQVFKRLAAKGVAFVSLSEAISYDTPEGRLQLTILGSFSAYFSDVLAKHVSKGVRERVTQGRHSGHPPLGYASDDQHRLVVDPKSAPAVRDAFAAYAAGASLRSLVILFASAGYPVRRSGVYYILRNRVYIGLVQHLDQWYAGTHERLIDDATWQACQAHLETNRRLQNAPSGRLRLFSGLLRCVRCGGPVQGVGIADDSPIYQCSRHRDYAACDAPPARETTLAAQIPAILAQLVLDDDTVARLAAQQTPPPVIDREAIAARLERLRLTFELGDIGRERYLGRRADLLRERDAADAPPIVDYAAIAKRIRNLVGLWQNGTPEQRRQVLTNIFRDILLDGRFIVAVQPQAPLAPFMRDLWQPHERAGFYVPQSR